MYPYMIGVNYDGSVKFEFHSTDDLGVTNFSTHPEISVPVVGWINENGRFIDYYFSINMETGDLSKFCRAY